MGSSSSDQGAGGGGPHVEAEDDDGVHRRDRGEGEGQAGDDVGRQVGAGLERGGPEAPQHPGAALGGHVHRHHDGRGDGDDDAGEGGEVGLQEAPAAELRGGVVAEDEAHDDDEHRGEGEGEDDGDGVAQGPQGGDPAQPAEGLHG